jgi:hypothetical protein
LPSATTERRVDCRSICRRARERCGQRRGDGGRGHRLPEQGLRALRRHGLRSTQRSWRAWDAHPEDCPQLRAQEAGRGGERAGQRVPGHACSPRRRRRRRRLVLRVWEGRCGRAVRGACLGQAGRPLWAGRAAGAAAARARRGAQRLGSSSRNTGWGPERREPRRATELQPPAPCHAEPGPGAGGGLSPAQQSRRRDGEAAGRAERLGARPAAPGLARAAAHWARQSSRPGRTQQRRAHGARPRREGLCGGGRQRRWQAGRWSGGARSGAGRRRGWSRRLGRRGAAWEREVTSAAPGVAQTWAAAARHPAACGPGGCWRGAGRVARRGAAAGRRAGAAAARRCERAAAADTRRAGAGAGAGPRRGHARPGQAGRRRVARAQD